jgi:uncharacterized repeat protein (TIGR01451 family)
MKLSRIFHVSTPCLLRRVAIVLLLLLFGHAAPAGLRVGRNFTVSDEAGLDLAPVVAANAQNGQFLAVWTAYEPDLPTVPKVYGRRIGADGKPKGSRFLISRRVDGNPTLGGGHPAVAYNAKHNEFLVAYERSYAGSLEHGIFGQRVSAAGEPSGAELTLAEGLGQTRPALAYDANANRYLLVWSNSSGLWGRVLEGDGRFRTLEIVLAPVGAARPAVAFDPDADRYLLAYEAPSATVTDVFGQRVDEDGQAVGAAIPLGEAAGRQSEPAVVYLGSTRRFLAVWSDNRLFSAAGTRVYGQFVDAGGLRLGGNLRLADYALGPKIAFAPAEGRLLLTWLVEKPGSDDDGFIRGRLFRPNLRPNGGALRISGVGDAGRPALAINPAASGALAAWARAAGDTEADIRGQMLDVSPVATELKLTLKGSPNPVSTGEPLAYTLSVRNDGPVKASGLVLADTLPKGVGFVSAEPGAGECEHQDGTVTCALDALKPGQSLKVTITVRPSAAGRIRNRATLTWTNRLAETTAVKARTTNRVREPE